MLFASIHAAVINSPTEWQLVLGLLVCLALLGTVSLALAWLAQRIWFPESPRRKRIFWTIAASTMTAGLAAVAVPFFLFIW